MHEVEPNDERTLPSYLLSDRTGARDSNEPMMHDAKHPYADQYQAFDSIRSREALDKPSDSIGI